MQAYEAAGGRVRRDLFSEQGTGYLQDPALLDRLASERLESVAGTVRAEGWSWVVVVPRLSSSELYAFARCQTTRREPTKAQAQQRRALDKQLQELQAQVDEEEYEDKAERLDQQIDDAEQRLPQLEDSLIQYEAEALAMGGAIVCAGRHGAARVHRGLIRSQDHKQSAGPQHAVAGGDTDEGREPKGQVRALGGADAGVDRPPHAGGQGRDAGSPRTSRRARCCRACCSVCCAKTLICPARRCGWWSTRPMPGW